MNCWHCDRPAHGSCFFCGRAVCKEHYRSMPGVLEMFRDRLGTLRGLVVDTVLWCGVCTPKRYPVNLDAVDPAQPSEATEQDESDYLATNEAAAEVNDDAKPPPEQSEPREP